MKIAMINGSPKSNNSASGELLIELKTCFGAGTSIEEFQFNKPELSVNLIQELNEFDAFIFAYPLYVDGIPAHLLSCLELIQQVGLTNNNISVYCVTNSGFFEGKQNANAIEILHHWCKRVGLQWGMGIGIGGGGSLAFMGSAPLGKGPKKSLGIAFNQFAKNIEKKSEADNIYVSINIPRFLYKFGAQIGWKQQIKANGGKTKDLDFRY